MATVRYRYRAYPDQGQARAAARLFGCCRLVWNEALAARENEEKPPSSAELSKMLTASKHTTERAFLNDVSSVPLQQSLADLQKAYSNFFNSLSGKRKGPKMRPPKFKKRTNRQSARFTRNAGFKVRQTTHGVGFVTLPKVGRVRFNLSRPLPSEASSVTFTLEPDGRYYVSFVVKTPDEPPTREDDKSRVAGMDLGLTDFATVVYSDGEREKIANPRWSRTRSVKTARAQRALSRKKPGSKNREKARRRVAVAHRRAREARADHHKKLALRLSRENQAVAVEGLSISGLGRTPLARSVYDAGWGLFLSTLHAIAAREGCEVRVCGRWEPTSQTCSVCGAPDGRKPLGIRAWICGSCNTELDRDYNAAVNIMVAAGLAETLNACGGSVRRRLAVADPVKQEPTEQTGAYVPAA